MYTCYARASKIKGLQIETISCRSEHLTHHAEPPGFRAGTPERVFEGPYLAFRQGRGVYDVAADGQRFIMIRNATNVSPAERPQFIIVQNWFEELKRLVPTD